MAPRAGVGDWPKARIDEARALVDSGISMTAVAARFGVGFHTLRCKIDPQYATTRRARNNELRYADGVKEPSKGRITVTARIDPDCIAARLAEIPRFDRRDLTARLFGDPLPERSALYRRSTATDRET